MTNSPERDWEPCNDQSEGDQAFGSESARSRKNCLNGSIIRERMFNTARLSLWVSLILRRLFHELRTDTRGEFRRNALLSHKKRPPGGGLDILAIILGIFLPGSASFLAIKPGS